MTDITEADQLLVPMVTTSSPLSSETAAERRVLVTKRRTKIDPGQAKFLVNDSPASGSGTDNATVIVETACWKNISFQRLHHVCLPVKYITADVEPFYYI